MIDDLPPEQNTETPALVEAASSSFEQPTRTPWSLRDLLLFIIFCLLALVAANFLVLAGYDVAGRLLKWRGLAAGPAQNALVMVWVQAVFYGLILVYVYVLVVLNYRQPFWRGLGWRTPSASRILLLLLGGLVMAATIQFVPRVLPDKPTFPLERLFNSTVSAYSLAIFSVTVAPFMEELIFRGVLFAIFEKHVGLAFAVISTAVLFAGLHVPEYWGAWQHALLILFVGLVFSIARGASGSLAPSVFLHVGYNGTLMTALFFQTHHFRTFEALLGLWLNGQFGGARAW